MFIFKLLIFQVTYILTAVLTQPSNEKNEGNMEQASISRDILTNFLNSTFQSIMFPSQKISILYTTTFESLILITVVHLNFRKC